MECPFLLKTLSAAPLILPLWILPCSLLCNITTYTLYISTTVFTIYSFVYLSFCTLTNLYPNQTRTSRTGILSYSSLNILHLIYTWYIAQNHSMFLKEENFKTLNELVSEHQNLFNDSHTTVGIRKVYSYTELKKDKYK